MSDRKKSRPAHDRATRARVALVKWIDFAGAVLGELAADAERLSKEAGRPSHPLHDLLNLDAVTELVEALDTAVCRTMECYPRPVLPAGVTIPSPLAR